MVWGWHPETLIVPHLKLGTLVESVPETPLYVPLYGQETRSASALLDGPSRAVVQAVRGCLIERRKHEAIRRMCTISPMPMSR